MYKLLLLMVFLLGFMSSEVAQNKSLTLKEACEVFNLYHIQVRDGLIGKRKAKQEFAVKINAIALAYNKLNKKRTGKVGKYFPLLGYNIHAVGGKNGSGYQAGGYSYFDGNKHAGHPAHDIFIHDSNQDDLDDATLKPVSIVAMDDGVVIAVEHTWATTSNLRGGKYVYIYNPATKRIFYYAHCRNIVVSLGDVIDKGQLIATVGRTGLNAHKRRSPTHLHLMLLMLDLNNMPYAVDCWKLMHGGL
jgi:peptidoglycan LD-endopeptidase LytH